MRGQHRKQSGCQRVVVTVLLLVVLVILLLSFRLAFVLFLRRDYDARSAGYDVASADSDAYSDGPILGAANFSNAEGRVTYEADGLLVDKTGVDVSDHQGAIDWEAVAADGIRFALIRIGYRGTTVGNVFPDQLFYDNLHAAQAAGIECGVYFFSQATTIEEAREEAELTLQLLDGTPLEYPVVYDHEPLSGERARNLSFEESTALAQEFCNIIENGGYSAMIYGNCYDLDRIDADLLASHQIWVAEYGSYPSYERRFSIWQYTNTGTVAGIQGSVDMNLDLSEAFSDYESEP